MESLSTSTTDHNRRIELVIGLDFGTSFSKVIVGEERVRYAVPFDSYAVGRNPLLLPSALCVLRGSGKCVLSTDRQRGTLHDNLKMPLIERDFSNEVRARAAAYLALVFRHTRAWLFDVHGSIYKDRKIEWFINVGLPTDSYEDNELSSVYRAIVRTAWRVSLMSGDVTLPSALDLLTRDDIHTGELQEESAGALLPDDRINTFPEFVAQLAGYVRSPRRRGGLHVTVDVGGGTLDVTVFNVHKSNGEDVYPIFDRKVEALGVRYLVTARLSSLQGYTSQAYSPFDDLPSDAAFRKEFGIAKDQLESVDQKFQKKVISVIGRALLNTRERRYATAPQWRSSSDRYGEPLPSFFCGGGTLSRFYADLLYGFAEKEPPFRLRASELPAPDDLEPRGMTPREYARLAVAYGLSSGPFDIGQVRRKSEVDDAPEEKPRSTYTDRYPGPEVT